MTSAKSVPKNSIVCVDASLVIKLVVPERFSAQADALWSTWTRQGCRPIDPDDMHQRAWELARRFRRPTAYDSHYLALAERAGCPFWTADERLFNTVHGKLSWVHWLGDTLHTTVESSTKKEEDEDHDE